MTRRDDMEPVTGSRLEMLRSLGFAELTHDSHVPFLSHLLGTRRVLADWGCREALCDAGLFHSVYGTEYFEVDVTVPRDRIRQIIGADAENIAWLWCSIGRDTIDPVAGTALDRHTGTSITLDPGELRDIATLWAADTVEQLDRMAPHERRFTQGLPVVLHLASPSARDAVAQLALGDPPPS